VQQYAAFETSQHVILFTQKNENQKLTQGSTPSPTVNFDNWFPGITILKDFHGYASECTASSPQIYSKRACSDRSCFLFNKEPVARYVFTSQSTVDYEANEALGFQLLNML
jgi:hypothetical protein